MYFLFHFFSLQRIPFAVVGSNTVLEVGGKKIRGRKYPWGIVEGKDFFDLNRWVLCFKNVYPILDIRNSVFSYFYLPTVTKAILKQPNSFFDCADSVLLL